MSLTIETQSYDDTYDHFLDEMAKNNFENSDGTFYRLRQMLNNISYDELLTSRGFYPS